MLWASVDVLDTVSTLLQDVALADAYLVVGGRISSRPSHSPAWVARVTDTGSEPTWPTPTIEEPVSRAAWMEESLRLLGFGDEAISFAQQLSEHPRWRRAVFAIEELLLAGSDPSLPKRMSVDSGTIAVEWSLKAERWKVEKMVRMAWGGLGRYRNVMLAGLSSLNRSEVEVLESFVRGRSSAQPADIQRQAIAGLERKRLLAANGSGVVHLTTAGERLGLALTHAGSS